MNNKVKVYQNGQFSGHIYQKKDGSFTTWSKNDVLAVYMVVTLIGAAVLALLA